MLQCFTDIQEAQGVSDSLELFKADTSRMAKNMADPALVSHCLPCALCLAIFIPTGGVLLLHASCYLCV